ncbi:MAG TPA: hypothetical protein VL418_00910 [Devosiaceae bacterium]|nr:hypothetical protein [Devosiaceae bacterium]
MAGIVVGVLSGFAVAQLQPGPTFAAVAERPPFTYGKALDTHLAKFNGDYYAVGTESNVSLEPESDTVIRKIGYGQTNFVHIITTPSGTYSSDGLFSPNIRYPGIHVEHLQLTFPTLTGQILGWSQLTGWTKIPLFADDGFGFLQNNYAPNSQQGVCVLALGLCR